MKKYQILGIALAVALFISLSSFAADVNATITGKVSVQNNVASIAVSEAKDASGKAIADLNGKSLKVIGAKAGDVVKLDGKEVTASGTVKNNAEIDVISVKEKAVSPAPAKK